MHADHRGQSELLLHHLSVDRHHRNILARRNMSGADVLDEASPLGRAHRVVVSVQEAQADDSIDGVVVGEIEDVDRKSVTVKPRVENAGTLIR